MYDLAEGKKSGFDVTDFNAMVIGQERSRHYGGGIALNEDPVWSYILQNWVQMGEDCGRQRGQFLPGLHQVQVDIWDDGE